MWCNCDHFPGSAGSLSRPLLSPVSFAPPPSGGLDAHSLGGGTLELRGSLVWVEGLVDLGSAVGNLTKKLPGKLVKRGLLRREKMKRIMNYCEGFSTVEKIIINIYDQYLLKTTHFYLLAFFLFLTGTHLISF